MQKHTLSKTNYLQFLACPEELWLQKNRPDLIPKLDIDALHKIEQGNLIDGLAREWFKNGCVLKEEVIDPDKVSFQLKVEKDGIVAIADIVVHHPSKEKHIRLFEVKSSTNLKKQHIHDIAFQKMVFEGCGYTVTDSYLVLVNKKYIHSGTIDHCELLDIDKVTKEVGELKKSTKKEAKLAMEWIHGPMPLKQWTIDCPNKLKCPFLQYHYKNIPAYSIYDISNIRIKKISKLLEDGVINILDVPKDFKLSKKQRIQVEIAQEEEIRIKSKAIKRELKELTYPLYFIDYESFSYVIPAQEEYRPYQQLVFQYSLHTRRTPDGPLEHTEFLLRSKDEPVEQLVAHMHKHIGDTGSLIVWNESFEKTRNKEMAVLYPIYADFLASMNDRMFDLMKIFKKDYYSHPGFKGKNSLKSVLPTLCPDISYKSLVIQNGNTAAIKWHHATDKRVSAEEAEKVFGDLLKYCHLDTLAMVKILEKVERVL